MRETYWERVKRLQENLEQGATVRDDERLEAAHSVGIGPTNAEYAAFLKVRVIAPLAGQRLQLSEQLLNEFL